MPKKHLMTLTKLSMMQRKRTKNKLRPIRKLIRSKRLSMMPSLLSRNSEMLKLLMRNSRNKKLHSKQRKISKKLLKTKQPLEEERPRSLANLSKPKKCSLMLNGNLKRGCQETSTKSSKNKRMTPLMSSHNSKKRMASSTPRSPKLRVIKLNTRKNSKIKKSREKLMLKTTATAMLTLIHLVRRSQRCHHRISELSEG